MLSRTWVITILTGLVIVGAASANTLALNPSPPATVVGQTAANPCFYGGNNCQNPSGWVMLPNAEPAKTYSGSVSYILANSPYSSVFGTGSFLIGVDINDTNKPQAIEGLTVSFSTGESYSLDPVPASVPNSQNGVGKSDYIINLNTGGAIPVPAGATTVTFNLSLSGLNDGPDRLFVIPQSTTVPDGGMTVMLLGGALVGLEALRRRFAA